jgi:shikimate dehydrogenase
VATKTYLTGLIGAEIAGSLSPALHNAGFAALGLKGEYQPFDTVVAGKTVADLPGLLKAKKQDGFDGFNVTHPFKTAILPLLDEISDSARDLGAVNTVVIKGDKLIGHNTDWIGFAAQFQSLMNAGVARGPVLVLGAGGAGRAVLHALNAAGEGDIRLYDPIRQNAASLADGQSNITIADDPVEAARDAVGIINASTVGMHGKGGLPLDRQAIRPDHWIAEVIYFPLETPLVLQARMIGCQVATGDIMCFEQAIAAFELMTGLNADRATMAARFADLLSPKA